MANASDVMTTRQSEQNPKLSQSIFTFPTHGNESIDANIDLQVDMKFDLKDLSSDDDDYLGE